MESKYSSVGLQSADSRLQWYWKVLAYVASCVILGGFLILPSTFDSDAQLRVSKAALGIFGVALLTAGFSLTALVCFACRNESFQADCVLMPCLTSCILGLLSVFYCFIISKRYEWNVAALLVTIGAAVSIVVYAGLLIYTQRRIAALRKNPSPINIPLAEQPGLNLASPGLTYHDQTYYNNHTQNMYPTSRPHSQHPRIPPEELSEEDLMRQQMLMLLVAKPQPQAYPDSSANTFNRIDFTPTDDEPPSLPAPGFYGYYAPSASRHSSQQSWSQSTLQPWDGIWRGPTIPNSVSREERRREIEQGRR